MLIVNSTLSTKLSANVRAVFTCFLFTLVVGCAGNPLHTAIVNDDFQQSELLITGGEQDLDKKDFMTQKVALHLAATKDQVHVAKLLTDNGASLEVQDAQGNYALHLSRSDKMVEHLLDAGADINAVNFKEETPLIYQAGYVPFRNEVEVDRSGSIGALIERGSDLTLTDQAGNTALHLAAGYEDIGTVKRLLESHIDSEILNNTGFRAYDVAAKNDLKEVARVFLEKGVKPMEASNEVIRAIEDEEERALIADDSYQVTAMSHYFYAQYQEELGNTAVATDAFEVAGTNFKKSNAEMSSALEKLAPTLEKATKARAARQAGSILLSLAGMALAANTGSGYMVSLGDAGSVEVLEQRITKYGKLLKSNQELLKETE